MVAVTGYEPHPVTRSAVAHLLPRRPPARPSLPPAGGRARRPAVCAAAATATPRPVAAAAQPASPSADAGAGDGAAAPPVAGPRVLGRAPSGSAARRRRAADARRSSSATAISPATRSFPTWRTATSLLSAVRWLAREERDTAIAARIPVPPLILLTGRQMQLVFLIVVVLLPLSVIALGCLVWWRRR